MLKADLPHAHRRSGVCEFLESRRLMAAGATTPYITYEAESGNYTGTLLGPSLVQNTVAAESSGRQAVRLATAGQSVQITASADANSVVVRYSMSDAAGGGGINSTINLLVNGVFVKTLALTSKYSYLYGAYPYVNTPASGSPRNFYDEVRASDLTIHAGDTVTLQRTVSDNGAYCDVDLIDLENVAAPLAQPAGSNWINVKSFNAVGNGVVDDTTAIRNAVNSAISQGKSLFIPAGTYKLTSFITGLHDVTIQGAGMWATTFVGDDSLYGSASRRVGFMGGGNNIHLNDFAIVGNLTYRNDSEANDGIGGSFGTGSTIARLWVEHVKTGMWIVNSNGLTVTDSRLRDTIADGINFVVGMRNCTVSNCTARGTGDDAFAMWPATYLAQTYAPGLNAFSHCTGLVPFLANGGAIYGGQGNTIDNCLFQDIPYGSGVLISGTFEVGANTFTGTTTVSNTDLIRAGGSTTLAAVQLAMANHPIAGVVLSNLNLRENSYSGVGISNNQTLTAMATNLNIGSVGLAGAASYGVYAQSGTSGTVAISNSTLKDYNNASANLSLAFSNIAGALPGPWITGDIGGVGVKGSSSFGGETYSVKGSGSDIAGTADAFHFVSQSVAGDTTLIARVDSLTNTNAAAKAGVMFRAGNATGAMFVGVFVTPGSGVSLITRTTTGGNVTSSTASGIAPQWLKLLRSGNAFTAFYSSDSMVWTQLGSTQTVAMNTTALGGLAVTSRNNSSLATAVFSNVSVAPTFATIVGTTLKVIFTSSDSITLTASGGGVIATQAGATLSFANVANIAVTFDSSGNDLLTLAGAVAPIAFAGGVGGLNLAAGTSASLAAADSVRLSSLSIADTARLDIGNVALILEYKSNSPAAAVRSYLTAGYNGGAFNGAAGIVSSTATGVADSGIGYAEASEALGPEGGVFAGQSVVGSAVLIRLTYLGDTNLDRKIDIVDLGALSGNWHSTDAAWSEGDFNYSGNVDIVDLGMLSGNYQKTFTPPTAPLPTAPVPTKPPVVNLPPSKGKTSTSTATSVTRMIVCSI